MTGGRRSRSSAPGAIPPPTKSTGSAGEPDAARYWRRRSSSHCVRVVEACGFVALCAIGVPFRGLRVSSLGRVGRLPGPAPSGRRWSPGTRAARRLRPDDGTAARGPETHWTISRKGRERHGTGNNRGAGKEKPRAARATLAGQWGRRNPGTLVEEVEPKGAKRSRLLSKPPAGRKNGEGSTPSKGRWARRARTEAAGADFFRVEPAAAPRRQDFGQLRPLRPLRPTSARGWPKFKRPVTL